MKTILTKKGEEILLYNRDYERVKNYTWGVNSQGYARHSTTIKRKDHTILLHRFIMKCPKGMEIDHKNGNRLDNRRSNLRIATHIENCQNSAKTSRNTSGYKGVVFIKDKQRWRASITSNGKTIYLGQFKNPRAAGRKYDEAAKVLFGQFARFNF